MAASQINVAYSALEIPMPISVLENYAHHGILNTKFAQYYQYIPINILQELRNILIQSIKISPAVASEFLDTQQGKFILKRLTELIKTQSHTPELEFQNLRTALISAAGEPEGLNLLNLLRKYPQDTISIDVVSAWKIAKELEQMISATQKAIAILTQTSNLEAATISPDNLSQLPQQPNLPIQIQTLNLFDSLRNRHLPTDIYIPKNQNSAPIIVISHGLGLNSSNFRYLGKYLANYGFVVVIPNHPNSHKTDIKSLINNSSNQVIPAHEFKDRPLDIKYILDQLALDSQFRKRLNLQQVGVFGQSLGGYTALALAGAKINFQQLKKDCNLDILKNTWNMSLLSQCQALELQNQSTQAYNLQDQRVKAAIAVNPITSSIFGQSGLSQIHTPIMIIGSSEDTVAPALYEQILPFSWLTYPHKYLVMLLGATHFSTIGNSYPESTQIALPKNMVGDASQARRYMNALSLPFFQTYVAQKSEYISYLNAAYFQTISSQSLGLNFVQSFDHLKLLPVLNDHFQPNNFAKKNFLIS
ncbi:MAG: alpha/beta hydrolase [Dolichospermum sp.]